MTGPPSLVAIGGSAGALEPLRQTLSVLPPSFPAPILVCIHRHAESDRYLKKVLEGSTDIEIVQPSDGCVVSPGTVYIAPPDVHLALKRGRIVLSHGPKENLSRPAIDVTFRAIAVEGGPNSVGVLLSGMLSDGRAGLSAITRCGGKAIVQTPNDAKFPDMPKSAIDLLDDVIVLDSSKIGGALTRYVGESGAGESGAEGFDVPEDIRLELDAALGHNLDIDREEAFGERSRLTCPECHGILWETGGDSLVRFRCHTGHAFSAEALEAAQLTNIESSMWIAMRALRERAETLRRLAAMRPKEGADFQRRAEECDRAADIVANGLLEIRNPALTPKK